MSNLTPDHLLKCPFCGWEGRHVQTGDPEWPCAVRCENCQATTDANINEDHAAQRWNMRAPSHD